MNRIFQISLAFSVSLFLFLPGGANAAMSTCGPAAEAENVPDNWTEYNAGYVAQKEMEPAPGPGFNGYWHTIYGVYQFGISPEGGVYVRDDGSDYMKILNPQVRGSVMHFTWAASDRSGPGVFYLFDKSRCFNGVYFDEGGPSDFVGRRVTEAEAHYAWGDGPSE